MDEEERKKEEAIRRYFAQNDPEAIAERKRLREEEKLKKSEEELMEERKRRLEKKKQKKQAKREAAKLNALQSGTSGQNTSVFLSGIPNDATFDDVLSFLSKGGAFRRNLDGKERIKLYFDENGIFKGEALAQYQRPESSDLIIELRNGVEFIYADGRVSKEKVSVSQAQFSSKESSGSGEGSNKKERVVDSKEKIRQKQRIRKLEQKDLAWTLYDNTPFAQQSRQLEPKHLRRVIVKHAFTRLMFSEEMNMKDRIKQEMIALLSKKWKVEYVTVYENHPECIVAVLFQSQSDAQKAVEYLHQVEFNGQRVAASLEDDSTRRERLEQENKLGVVLGAASNDGDTERYGDGSNQMGDARSSANIGADSSSSSFDSSLLSKSLQQSQKKDLLSILLEADDEEEERMNAFGDELEEDEEVKTDSKPIKLSRIEAEAIPTQASANEIVNNSNGANKLDFEATRMKNLNENEDESEEISYDASKTITLDEVLKISSSMSKERERELEEDYFDQPDESEDNNSTIGNDSPPIEIDTSLLDALVSKHTSPEEDDF
eukprot:MONOS_10532.1-p1 / transcript=MONOS_10532.1 / gene=MONOS_10532 / organism=Monocercomonoides_exilis_PA203 / gene_product=nuclear mrna splicing factor-associated / transcript_product=nuclear mrna splicing factor-associated / location=Mono_scaffold00482:36396-38471(+) / protein_length=547 / sequence_SO=supercontig / SO=protein_coding / is_pseudo=false